MAPKLKPDGQTNHRDIMTSKPTNHSPYFSSNLRFGGQVASRRNTKTMLSASDLTILIRRNLLTITYVQNFNSGDPNKVSGSGPEVTNS